MSASLWLELDLLDDGIDLESDLDLEQDLDDSDSDLIGKIASGGVGGCVIA